MCDDCNFGTYIPEPKRNHRSRWSDKPREYRNAVYANRHRAKGERGKRLQRLRSDRVERSFAHVCETGGARRSWLIGLAKVTKRYRQQAVARNLGLILRKLFGMGTPRGLQPEGALAAHAFLIAFALRLTWPVYSAIRRPSASHNSPTRECAATGVLTA